MGFLSSPIFCVFLFFILVMGSTMVLTKNYTPLKRLYAFMSKYMRLSVWTAKFNRLPFFKKKK